MQLHNIKTVKEIMSMFGLRFRKEYGQNFLTSAETVCDTADLCCNGESHTILEIGPGIGTLTRELCERYPNVIAVEIDKGLIPVLDYTLSGFSNFHLINDDIMKSDLNALLEPYMDGGVSVCANLPYYITTPILMRLLESGIPFGYITVMVQAEVADRICAVAGSADCGAITSVIAYYGNAEILFRVPAEDFIPAPKVDSAVVRIKIHKEKPFVPKSEALLFRTIKAAFAQRRKTLVNALSAGFSEISKSRLGEIIVECGHAADIRGEKLGISEFTALSDAIYDEIQKSK